MSDRESMDYDVVVVGAGPSGLACAIHLKQLAVAKGQDISICILEKGAEVGAHILSGAVIEPRALRELFPNWESLGAPLHTPANKDRFLLLGEHSSWTLPTPPQMHNAGNFIVSLGELCRWLAGQAEQLDIEIYPGFSGAELLLDEKGAVRGVATGDQGIGKDGQPTTQFQRGMELRAKQTVFAEGCRGSLTKMLFERFNLREGADPQTYGLGIKELWEVSPDKSQPGDITHTVGWPLPSDTYGGSWLYHLKDNLVSVGFVVGLDYRNPYLSPFEEFQRFKNHPSIRPLFEGGRRISYGARALSEGGIQSLPKLTFPGGLLIGDTAGFLNVPKIKGTHTAMKSGIEAAAALSDFFGLTESKQNEIDQEANTYPERLKQTWLWDELHAVRNIRPSFRWGLWGGMAYSAIDTYLFRGRAPWTFRHHADHTQLISADEAQKIDYPKPDGVVSFDRLSSVFLSNTNHAENQPIHLKLKNPELAIDLNFARFSSPEQRYCPAGVYEIISSENAAPRLLINAQNCVHCKSCDIKDPSQNIDWSVPEGGGGPNYAAM
jgi:electron-transferring-flavoprotein dehydrogenase